MIHTYRIEHLKRKNVKNESQVKNIDRVPSKNCVDAIISFSRSFETKKSAYMHDVEWIKN